MQRKTTEQRPVTRGDCASAARPCKWKECRYHLFRDDGEADEAEISPRAAYSCSLDVADLGGSTLEDVGNLMGLTRERVRQIESSALLKLRRAGASRGAGRSPLVDFADKRTHIKMLEAQVSRLSESLAGARARLRGLSSSTDEKKVKSAMASIRKIECGLRTAISDLEKVKP